MFERVNQIDCNNPSVDRCVVSSLGINEHELVVTEAGRLLIRNQSDNVPFSCPLTQSMESDARSVENFVKVCSDCPHSFI